ncbi:MAG: AMP-binding protein, partial [Bacteroidetes bacterium]|nr:AMP-binding protein [Bacteroidota bacterium]
MQSPVKLYPVPAISSLQEMIIKSANTYGDKLALEDLNETPIPRLSYSAVMKQILKFGAALQSLGLKERSHIAVVGENRVQWAL